MDFNKIVRVFVILSFLVLLLAATIAVQRALLGTMPSIQIIMDDSAQSINVGDLVEVGYTARLKNGSLVERTNISFIIGSEEVILGLSDAVIGLLSGDNKTVEIHPDKAFGQWDPDLVQIVERVQSSPRTQNSTASDFEKTFGKVPETGAVYLVPDLNWTITVLTSKPENVIYRYSIPLGSKVETPFGMAGAVTVEDEIKIILPTKNIGDPVQFETETARVTNITDDYYKIDFNNRLVGETLTFDIEVRSVNFTGNIVTLKYFWSEYCPYCKKEEPILQKFLGEHPSLNFIRIDINKEESFAQMERYNAYSTPTFVLIDRTSTKVAVGFLTEKQLNKFLCSKLKDEACEDD